MIHPLCLALLLIPAAPAAPTVAGQDDPVPTARERYDALLEAHGGARAIDIVGSTHRKTVTSDGKVVILAESGEAHCARGALGWVRLASAEKLEGDREDEEASSATESVGTRSLAAGSLARGEWLGNGRAILQVDRKARTTVELGDRWFAFWPALSPMQAWTGEGSGRVEKVEQLRNIHRPDLTGLKVHFRSFFGRKDSHTETLWLDKRDRLVSAEVRFDRGETVETHYYEFTRWVWSAEFDPAAYLKEAPQGFEALNPYADLEADLLAPGSEAPDVQFGAMQGEDFSLASLRGKAVLLTFWFEH